MVKLSAPHRPKPLRLGGWRLGASEVSAEGTRAFSTVKRQIGRCRLKDWPIFSFVGGDSLWSPMCSLPKLETGLRDEVWNTMATSGSSTQMPIVRSRMLARCYGPVLIVALAVPPLVFPKQVEQQEASNSAADGARGSSGLLCLTCAGPGKERLLALIPNHRTASALADYKPLTVKQKFAIAFKESTEPGTFVLAAATGAIALARGSNPSFGEEFGGYAHYVGTRYTGYVISDFMRDGMFPSLLHQDPRYFRRGAGSGWRRVEYAIGQVFWTRSDSGDMGFNYSQTIGAAAAAAISTAYYPETRDVRHATCRFEAQIGARMASNVMREFWPDLQRILLKRQSSRP